MEQIGLTAAKSRLNELLDRVEADEVIEITRRGRPVARLTPVAKCLKGIEAAMLRSIEFFRFELNRKNLPSLLVCRAIHVSGDTA